MTKNQRQQLRLPPIPHCQGVMASTHSHFSHNNSTKQEESKTRNQAIQKFTNRHICPALLQVSGNRKTMMPRSGAISAKFQSSAEDLISWADSSTDTATTFSSRVNTFQSKEKLRSLLQSAIPDASTPRQIQGVTHTA